MICLVGHIKLNSLFHRVTKNIELLVFIYILIVSLEGPQFKRSSEILYLIPLEIFEHT